MAKSIIIQEGGTPKQMGNVDKIRTDLQGGGSCLWVPEDEVQLTTKHITENGTYAAADDGKYGYSQVTVNVPGGSGGPPGGSGSSIVGTGEDGNDYLIGIDEDGNITETKVPSSIRVTTPPTNLDYGIGDTIDYSGIEVTSYDALGESMGAVPYDQLIFTVETANAAGGALPEEPGQIQGDGTYYVSNGGTVRACTQDDSGGLSINTVYISPGVRYAAFYTDGSFYVFAASVDDFEMKAFSNGQQESLSGAVGTMEYGGTTYHYKTARWWLPAPTPAMPYHSNTNSYPNTMIRYLYGPNSSQREGVGVPVSWLSPSGATLTASFSINVIGGGQEVVDPGEGGFSGGGGGDF